MKALGIVRKIDELGRVVIPKEVRTAQGWVAGTPIEMLADQQGIYMKEYGVDIQKEEVLKQLNAVKKHTENEVAKEMIQAAINFISKG